MSVESARCKFRVASVEDFGNDFKKVKLQAEYDTALSAEDRAFAKATPSGSMEFGVTNPAVFHLFKPGSKVYIDITPAE